MSTVLDADRELRRRSAAARSPDVAPIDQGPRFLWLRPVLVVVALAVGGTALVVFRPARDTALVPGVQTAPVGEPPAASEQLARVPALGAERGERDAPWGRMEKGSAAPPAARPVPPPVVRPVPPPARVAAKPPPARRGKPAVVDRAPQARTRAVARERAGREPAVVSERPLVTEPAVEP